MRNHRSGFHKFGRLLCLTSALVVPTNAQIGYNPSTYDTFTVVGGSPKAINNQGQVVGVADSRGYFRNLDGTYTMLEVANAATTAAFGISNNGLIVGAWTDTDGTHAFSWEAGTFTIFDAPGALATSFYGVNDGRDIVGSYTDSTGQHAFVLNGSGMHMLDSYALTAKAINNAGQILGNATPVTPTSNERGYILEPGEPPVFFDSPCSPPNSTGRPTPG